METTALPPEAAPAPRPPHPKIVRLMATIVSYVCHPIFLPTVMSLVLYKLMPVSFKGIPDQILKFRLASIILVTLFFPLLSVLLMKALGFVESIYLRTSKDRIIPLIASMTFYFWAYQVFSHFPDTPVSLKVLLLGCFWGMILLFMASIFFKVSMHTTAAGGMLGLMIMLLYLSPVNMMAPFFASLIIAGIIGTARLVLHEHTPAEIWMGYIIGLVAQLGAWLYLS
jgi:hypothetical protein